MNRQNLTQFTTENAKEMGSKGGKKSGEARRKNKIITDLLRDVLTKETNDMCNFTLLYNCGYEGNAANAAAVACALVDKASRGDVKAIRLILELTGELSRKTDSHQDS